MLDRAIKQTGEAMLNTHFILLNSDYIMADGSFQGLSRYIEKGYSGICAGNFQVIDEEIKPYLLSQINPDTGVMQIKPRELVKRSMRHLYPVTIASLFEYQATHNYRANRFFARLNHDVMAGRFYLQHVLCVKPETMHYRVGSSFDYSFIPEMCPSGNIAVINDSDDYLVIATQPLQHELHLVGWGGYHQKKLAHALSEWTTKQHRANAKQSIYFHSIDLTDDTRKALDAKLDHFTNQMEVSLSKYKEQPFYNHPYWFGAYESLMREQAILKNAKDYEFQDVGLSDISFAKKCFYKMMGVPPLVYPWHPRWYEYRLMREAFKSYITPENNQQVAVFYSSINPHFMRYSTWLKNALGVTHHYHTKHLSRAQLVLQGLQAHPFKLCMLMMSVNELATSLRC